MRAKRWPRPEFIEKWQTVWGTRRTTLEVRMASSCRSRILPFGRWQTISGHRFLGPPFAGTNFFFQLLLRVFSHGRSLYHVSVRERYRTHSSRRLCLPRNLSYYISQDFDHIHTFGLHDQWLDVMNQSLFVSGFLTLKGQKISLVVFDRFGIMNAYWAYLARKVF